MRTFLQPALILIGAKRISSVGCFLRLVLFSNQVLSRFFRNIPPTELVIADPDNCLISAFEVRCNNSIGNVEPISSLIAIVTIDNIPHPSNNRFSAAIQDKICLQSRILFLVEWPDQCLELWINIELLVSFIKHQLSPVQFCGSI